MKIALLQRMRLVVPLGVAQVSLGPIWLLLPLALWGLGAGVVPLSAPMLSPLETWAAALGAALALLLAPLLHALGHALAARLCGAPIPQPIPLELYGDAAQAWQPGPTALRELAVAIAGPVASGLQATLWALLWNAQLHPAINALAFLATMLNAGLAIVQLAPGAPLDGGRVLRGMLWGDLGVARHARIVGALGLAIGLALAGWGVALLSLQARFSVETGAATIGCALLLLLGLRHPAAEWPAPEPPPERPALGWLSAGLVFALLLAVASGMLPLVDGLYSPGPAVSVAPMVRVPEDRRSTSRGELLLTTVVAQTPITLAQWVFARFDPAFVIVAPERIVPRDTTPQEIMRQNVSMLEESEALAMVVGARLAGHPAELISTGLQVVEVLPESPSRGLLQPGDQLVRVGGAATPRLDLLRAELARRAPGEQVELTIERAGAQLSLQATLMEPAQAGGPPRIGVSLQPVGLDVQLPFPIAIEEQKIAGGPSAGLMFTLAVYDALTPEDITRGWRIAGTGTIALDGAVGPIGGVAQKVAGAERAGADYFITPREHEAEARQAARRIKIIAVGTAEEALAALRALPERPGGSQEQR